jgi:hypothetical protein
MRLAKLVLTGSYRIGNVSCHVTRDIAEFYGGNPAEKIPAERIPAEKIPAEKIPAEKIPAEKIPAEKIPAERIPASQNY